MKGGKGIFIIWILLVIAVIYLFQQNSRSTDSFDHREYTRDYARDALDILRERYARGEISEQEFNERKKILRQY